MAAVAPQELAAPQAAQIALQAGQVDAIVVDWMWVARQRATGADWSFVPFSNAVGALIAPDASPVRRVADLVGKRLGIAGSPLDKSWLILRAYAKDRLGIDLETAAERSFAAPSLLAEQMKLGRLDAVLTFWPFAARAEAAGARRVMAVEDAVAEMGIGTGVPYLGYTFSTEWAQRNPETLVSFLAASRQARGILARSDDEWRRLRPLTNAADDSELLKLRDWYRAGMPRNWRTEGKPVSVRRGGGKRVAGGFAGAAGLPRRSDGAGRTLGLSRRARRRLLAG
ncbi:MAG: ABC transporter substrate-binding protein [Alphaproteobacteria bacterium]|nr:ABC transporter substrate-binding protein [Alphaproteobacteria bacterium]